VSEGSSGQPARSPLPRYRFQVLVDRRKTVEAQPKYPENQVWVESRVTFAVLHIIGSNNGLDQWFGDRVINSRAGRHSEGVSPLRDPGGWLRPGGPGRRLGGESRVGHGPS
jgi:hypothetical protein